jgi:hypothetical protein
MGNNGEKRGRPTIYTPEIAEQVCQYIAQGMTLREVAAIKDMPGMTTICRWLLEVDKEAFWKQYAQARQTQAELEIDEIRTLADKCTPKNAHAVRLRVDARKFRVEKLSPKKYGNIQRIEGRVDHVHSMDEALEGSIREQIAGPIKQLPAPRVDSDED